MLPYALTALLKGFEALSLTSVVSGFVAMPQSLFEQATRAFVKVLVAIGRVYAVALSVNRDSPHPELLKGYKRVALKAHPDKGGTNEHFRALQTAKEKWDALRTTKAERPCGRRWENGGNATSLASAVGTGSSKTQFRVRGCSVLLTYQGFSDQAAWKDFLDFVRASLESWGVQHWCATLERSGTGKLHSHLVLQFRSAVDRSVRSFAFKGRLPNASVNDLLNEGVCRKKLQQSVDRGFFYVWADKEGTERNDSGQPCVEGDYQPVWTTARCRYAVLAKWCDSLWRQRKLSHERYEAYLYLAREGVLPRKRNLDAVREREHTLAEEEERVSATRRVRARFEAFELVPEAQKWLDLFKEERDRYPFLVVLGPSLTRKTEWAKSLFQNPLQLDVGTLDHFPDGMRAFDRNVHDGVVLDDVRDFGFLVHHQEKLQGKVDRVVTFAETPSGGYSYRRWLWRVPFVVTANYTTKQRGLLTTDDFLGNLDNRVLVERQAGSTTS